MAARQLQLRILAGKQHFLAVPDCVPLRKHHSWSAPSSPSLLLDGCLSRVKSLSGQLDRVSYQVRQSRERSLSVTDLPGLTSSTDLVCSLLEDLLSEIVKKEFSMAGNARQCHHCHRLLSHPEHTGVVPGVKQCTLSHYELCPGGRMAGPDWTGCPAIVSDESDTEGPEQTGATADVQNLERKSELMTDKFTSDPYGEAKRLMEGMNKVDNIVKLDDDDDDSSDDEEDKVLQSEIAQLRIQVQSDEAKLKAEKKEKKRLNRLRLEQEKAELLNMCKAQKKANLLKQNTASDHLHRKSAELAARQQQEAADRRAAQQAQQDKLTISSIRSLPGASAEVENLLTKLQALVPSLAKTPTAASSGPAFQPPGVLSSHAGEGDDIDKDYVFHPGRGKFVPVIHSPVRGAAGGHHQTAGAECVRSVGHYSDDETSADEDCPVEPPTGYRFVWKRDVNGEKYFVQKRAKKSITPEYVQTYVCDDSTGRWYKRSILKADLEKTQTEKLAPKKTHSHQHSSAPTYKDHRVTGSTPVPLVQRGCRTPVVSAPPVLGDRVAGIVPLDSEKQGRDNKMPDRIQWARNCPVNWTNKITSANINVVLWAWSYVSELLATRTGMAPNLDPGELEARLQHFCHVLEITLQTSGQTDFGGESWEVGRLYDKKVQQKVDTQQFSWVQLAAMNHGASMPHELIAATQELTRKPKISQQAGGVEAARGSGDGRTGKGAKKDKQDKATWKCPTWNKSETRGKCQWELDNPGEKCQGLHECNWCKSKSRTPVDHQRVFCRKRLAEEER